VEAVIAWHPPLMVGGYGWPPVGVLATTDFGKLAGQVLTDSIAGAVGSGGPVPVIPVVKEGNPADAAGHGGGSRPARSGQPRTWRVR
jgi:hypothetical protein